MDRDFGRKLRLKIVMFGLKGIPFTAGVEVMVEELGSRLVKRGHDVTVLVRPHYTPRSLTEYRGMHLVHLPSIPTKNFDAISHSFLSVFKSVSLNPDVVHIHSTGNSIFSFFPRWFGIPTVVTSHGLDWQRAKWGKLARWYLKMTDFTTCIFPTATVVVSRRLQTYYHEHYGRSATYIPNGASQVNRIPPDEIKKYGLAGNDYILFASRLVPEKGCHYLLEAFQKLDTPLKLVIAGDDNTDREYIKLLKKLAPPNVIFTGFVKGKLLEELLSNAYLYVLPSEIEGLSVGLIEAMNYQNCVLVSDISENLEVIGNAGMTFKNKSVADLMEKMTYIVNNPKYVEEQRHASYQSIQSQYNWEEVADQYEQLYTSIQRSH